MSTTEKRHAQNMIGDVTLIDKNNLNNYQVRVVLLLSILRKEKCHNLILLFADKTRALSIFLLGFRNAPQDKGFCDFFLYFGI